MHDMVDVGMPFTTIYCTHTCLEDWASVVETCDVVFVLAVLNRILLEALVPVL